MKFAAESLTALAELHGSEPVVGSATTSMIHRNISTETVLVRYDDTPILTGLELARIDASKSIGTVTSPEDPATAPEIIAQGLTAATTKSDVYSLSYCLATLFSDRDDDLSRQAAEILAEGTRNKIEARADLKEMIDSFHLLISERVDPQQPQEAGTPTAYLYWSAGQVVYFHGTPYRIIQSLGTGGIGRTWKVEQLDGQGLEPIGTIYVAKVTHNPEDGALALTAYSKARPYLADTPALATIFECASEWKENDFTALLEWKEGDPFKDLQGSFHEFDSPQEDSLRFLQQVLEGLSSLHNNNLIHGDISPANLIVSPGLDSLSLTDYDFVCNIGEPIAGQGTVPYSPDRAGNSNIASRSDDIFSLAASFFEVVFNPSYPNGDPRLPFEYDGNPDKSQGLNWDAIDKSQYPVLSNFLSRATNPDSDERYQTVESALHDLDRLPPGPYRPVPPTVLKQGHIERLIPLLESYPGSPLGNTETRGLDSPFAIDTYVRTPGFEDELEKDIEEKRVQLIIFCGNAGDGKTALLQHITTSIDLRITQSSSRIIEGTTSGGTQVLMNLDGSASWGSRSADEILDEFLQPFQDGPSASDAVHLLAINDGRLLEWISAVEYSKGSPTPLAQSLYNLLLEIPNGTGKNESHIRFVNLNDRSLVGRVDSDQNTITTDFLDELVDRLYGADRVSEIWAECGSCSASNHCAIYQSAGIFAPDGHPAWAGKDKKVRDKSRDRARRRLYDALQTVHLTGDIHITTRELRSTLVYILFGMHTCREYHSGTMHSPTRYWDLAFEPGSEYRQGDLLASISRLDPALESSPRIDRKLRKKPSDDGQDGLKTYPNLTTGSARRRAYFEWSEEEIHLAGNGRDDLILARGRHTDAFKRLAYETDNSDICKELLRGVARLQRLPAKADSREERVPLLIQTKTKVETSFWVEKPVSSFELKTNLEDAAADGFVPRLHRQAVLIYHYNNGQDPELLHLGSELFHVLLELARGYQLGDVSTDDNFAHLSLFVKRLLREDDDELFAWNPMEEAVIYRISTDIQDAVDGPFQPLVISQSN